MKCAVFISFIFHLIPFLFYQKKNKETFATPSKQFSNAIVVSRYYSPAKVGRGISHKSFENSPDKIVREGGELSHHSIHSESTLGDIVLPEIEYPEEARDKELMGTVKLKINFDNEGFPLQIEVISSSGFSILDNAAKKSFLEWKEKRLANQVRVIPVRFTIVK